MSRGDDAVRSLARTLAACRRVLELEGVRVLNLEPGPVVCGVFTMSLQVAFDITTSGASRQGVMASGAAGELGRNQWREALLRSSLMETLVGFDKSKPLPATVTTGGGELRNIVPSTYAAKRHATEGSVEAGGEGVAHSWSCEEKGVSVPVMPLEHWAPSTQPVDQSAQASVATSKR